MWGTYPVYKHGILGTKDMVPCGLDMGFHVEPLCRIQFWLEPARVEPTTFGESGNMLAEVRLPTCLPYVSYSYITKLLFHFATLFIQVDSGPGISPIPWSHHIPHVPWRGFYHITLPRDHQCAGFHMFIPQFFHSPHDYQMRGRFQTNLDLALECGHMKAMQLGPPPRKALCLLMVRQITTFCEMCMGVGFWHGNVLQS
jgi:hypothetical protein